MLTGTDSVFVRTSGCNLRCWFCDTPYTSWEPEGEDLSVDEILRQVDELLIDDEPCGMSCSPAASRCCSPSWCRWPRVLHERGLHITIETAGTLYLPVACDLMSISPKLAGSGPPADDEPRWHVRHERTRHVPDVIRRLVAEYPYQIKFVVDPPADCAGSGSVAKEFPADRSRPVLLMPQGIDAETLEQKAEWLEPYCRRASLAILPAKAHRMVRLHARHVNHSENRMPPRES